MYSSDCVFCAEVIRQHKASIVYEDEYSVAFMDLFPVEEGHTLIIPKEHYVNIFDIEPDSFRRVHELSRVMAKAVLKAVGADAINIGQNNGPCANQRVMHYHLHIIPRWCDRHLDWERIESDNDELDKVAEKIRNTFEEFRHEVRAI